MPAELIPAALFARAPSPGRAKTRLAPALGAEGAATLYRAFLHDTASTVARATELAPCLWAASAEDAAALRAEGLALPLHTQPAGDLGVRMCAALDHAVSRAGRAIVLGTDVPTLPLRALRRAAEALDHSDVVLGPTVDGGYYLIGVRERSFELGGVRWSSSHALADTLERARSDDRTVALLDPWYDVDTPEDLRLLRAHLRLRPQAAPHTARALGLSPRTDVFDRGAKP